MNRAAGLLSTLLLPVQCCALLLMATFVEVWLSPASESSQADVAIVLGAAVWRDRPSPVLAGRLEQAAAVAEQGRVEAVIVTGGRARGDRVSEAEAGRRYLLARGIAPERVLVEDRSTTTYENLVHARSLMSDHQTALLISDPLHLRRAAVMARDLGIVATPCPTFHTRYRSLGSRLQFAVRETVFLASYRVHKLTAAR